MKRRSAMTRWIIRILILLVILIIAGVVTVYFVLKSDLPRSVLLDTLRDQTGLRFDAASVDVTWSGDTVIKDLQIGLPLEDQPFATVRRVRVKHNPLVWLALTRSLNLSDVRIVDPVLTLRTEAGGQWNLIDAAQIVSLTRERNSDPTDPPSSLPDLPRLRIERAAVEVELPDGRELSYAPFAITGDPEKSLAWRFALTLENRIAVRGDLAPGAGWAHRVSFDLDEVRSLAEPFIASLPEPLDASGDWRGNIRSGTLAGSFTLDSVRAGDYSASGGIGAEVIGTQLRARPNNLSLSRVTTQNADAAASPIPDRLNITGGTIIANLERISASDIVGRLEGYADFELDGEWSLADSSGAADLAWRGAATRLLEEPIEHRGTLDAGFTVTPLGRLRLTANLSTSGTSAQRTWDLDGVLSASGDSLDDLTVSLDLPIAKLVTPQFSADLDGLKSETVLRWPVVSEAHLAIPDARAERSPLVLTAMDNASTLEWTAFANATDYTPPISSASLPEFPPLSIELRASGDRDRAVLDSLSASAEDTTVSAEGQIVLADLAATLSINAEQGPLSIGETMSALGASINAQVSGTLSPLDMEADGVVTVIEPRYKDRPLETISTAYAASASPQAFTMSMDAFEILGGSVRARAAYTTGESEARIGFTGDTISLAQIGELLDLPVELTGTTSAELAASIPLDDPSRTLAYGNWTASGMNVADLAMIEGEGSLRAGSGALRLPQLTLRHAGGVLRGSAEMDLNQADRLHVVFSLEDWPLEFEGASLGLTADGDADLFVSLAPIGATGTANLSADLRYRDQPAATVTLETSIEGRDLSVGSLTAETLGGSARGSGLVPLSSEFWERARFALEWSDIDFAEARELVPQLEPFTGTTDGTLDIRPAEGAHAELPMQLTLESNFTDARFADFTIGEGEREKADLVGLVHFGPDRAEIQNGSLVAASGTLDLYGRASNHDGEIALFANLIMNELDLQQIASAASLEDRPMPGLVSGEWSLGGSLNPPHRLFGTATMSLTNSDLLALPGIAQIYGALNLDVGTPEPRGEGKALLRLEGNTLEMTRLIYFNRGTDVVAGMTIHDIFMGAESPIEGVAVGSFRPLRAGPQSFFSALDRLLRASQANAVAVEIGGTIAEPKTQAAPLKDLTSSIERLLKGSAD